ncbi:hypothetical protein DICPUDRAFT_148631 [Dictyostelium purpureum]|uniref:non-specific serine/threonine protein kinase n=1 Tax=Dictyostelium purpureum TaxID=5786 RepID=F0ZBL5_DICPU|nr:uncharacterized protein DICPUDRAFT_148631 [Dictyostelium purpureum]EGC38713.1 hypothetical protein DICPUDRAFT_148631 [Dictyostelium purpureum]|eukprot:XP_003284809.1 hypothetical protein DICPUDRAFT_148631 [Dictyostelium purpureum]
MDLNKKDKEKEKKDKDKELKKEKKEKKKEKKDKEKKKDKDKDDKGGLFSIVGGLIGGLTDSQQPSQPPNHSTTVSAQSTTQAKEELSKPVIQENHKKAMDFWINNTATSTSTITTSASSHPTIVTTTPTPVNNNSNNSKTTNSNSGSNVKLNTSLENGGNNDSKKDLSNEHSPKNRKEDNKDNSSNKDNNIVETPADENRKKLVESLMKSLCSFSESIKIILDLFYTPLKKSELLSHEELKGIFSVIEMIGGFKQAILEDFKKYLSNWNSANQAALYSTFSQFVGYLKLYQVYALQYNYSLSSLSLLMFDNQKFETFIKNAESKLANLQYTLAPIVTVSSSSATVKPVSLAEILGPQYDQSAAQNNNNGTQPAFTQVSLRRTGNSTFLTSTGGSNSASGKFTQEYNYSNLASLLILPIHFLARFHHFFKTIMDSLPVLHPDYKPYNLLYKKITAVVKDIVTESVNINKVISISKSIKSPTIGLFNSTDIVQNRKFLKEGILIEQFNNQRVSYYTFLFSDLILFTEKIEDGSTITSTTLMPYEGSFYLLKKLERISNIQVDDPELGFEYRKGFQIKTKDSSIFYMTASEKEKSNWFQILSQATLNSNKSKSNNSNPYSNIGLSRQSISNIEIDLNNDDSKDDDDDPKDIASFCKMITSGQRPRVELNASLLKLSDPKPLFAALASTHFVNHLVFSPSTMSDKYMQMTLSMMSLNKSITHLTLSQNSINDSCAIALGDMLRYNHSLIQMDLSENQIGDKGLAALIDGILSHPSITVVILSQNQITDVGAKHIPKLLKFNQTLNALFLEDNNISNQMASEILDQWISNHTTVLTRIILPSIPNDYNEKIKTKAISIANRLDKKKKQINTSSTSSSNIKSQATSNINNSLIAPGKGILDIGSFDYSEISLQLLNKINMMMTDSRRLSDLKELFLDHNCISNIPVTILRELKNLQLLDLSNNQLSSLPAEICELKELVKLNVSHNNLASLPLEIGQLIKLTHLDISFNFIEAINVNSLSQLVNLKVLMMQRNYFNRLPISIFQKLNLLESFSINGSPCFHPIKQRIYESIAIRSTRLDLSDSGLSYLPIEIGSIQTLTELDLSNNRIKDLPPQIGKLSNLSILNLTNNQLEYLPWQLSQLTKLKLLNITGNQISFDNSGKITIPDVLSGEGLTGLLKYLKLSSTKEKPCMRMKLMLVGQENVGKTSIAKCLKKEIIPVSKKLRQTIGLGTKKNKTPTLMEQSSSIDFNAPQNINPLNTSLNISTDGINMDDWRPPSEDQSPAVTFSIWDFAGQEVYYSTHQFFISSRSVFIVVFDMSVYNPDEVSRVPYWLQCIEAFGGDSSVILVGTHLDELPNGVDINQITQEIHNKYFTKFPNLKLFLPVSCKSGKNINKLQNHIVKLGKLEKKLGEVYNRSFFQLESLILSEREMNTPPIITFDEFSDMAQSCGIPATAVNKAADFLKELGIIVYFDDVKSGLDQFIFIDPPWLTRLMATIITSKPNFVQSGVLDQSNLHQIWKPPDFPQHLHHVLLAILQKFEIVHPLPDKNNNSSNIKSNVPSKSSAVTEAKKAFNNKSTNQSSTTLLNGVSRFGNGSISKGSSLNLVKKLNEAGLNVSTVSSSTATTTTNSLSISNENNLVPKASTKHLVPILLSEERPNSIEKVMDHIINKEQNFLERIYQFEFLPVGFFSKLMIRTMHFTTVKEYWKNGLLVERDGSTCLIESIHSYSQINLKAWGTNPSNVLRFIIETAELLISGWYKLQFHFLVPCNCLNCISILGFSTGNSSGVVNGMMGGGPTLNTSNSSNSLSSNSSTLSLNSNISNTSSVSSASSTPSVLSPPLTNSLDSAEASGDSLDLDFSDYYEGDVSPGGTLKSKRKKNQNKFLTLYRNNKTNSSGSKQNQQQPIDLTKVSNMINQQLTFGPVFKSHDLRTMFLYEDIERTFLSKKFEMICKSNITGEETIVRLDSLVPELLMSDIGPNFTLEYKDLEIIEQVGEGGFGIVHKGKLRGELVAIKQIAMNGNNQAAAEEIYREFRREVWLSNILTHPSIVSLKGYCLDPCCIVMEYIPNGTLYSYLHKASAEKPIGWPLKLKISINIADAIKHMHNFTPKICHRDLKSPNILMLSDMNANVVCKVSDFGETRAVVTSALGRDKLSNPIWLSPEIMRGEEYTEKADVYSFGIVLWEILTGQLPFDEYPVAHSSFMYQLEDEIMNGLRPSIPAGSNADYVQLIKDCWQNDPLLRPTFPDIHLRLCQMAGITPTITTTPPPTNSPQLTNNNNNANIIQNGTGSFKRTNSIVQRPSVSSIFNNTSSNVNPVTAPVTPHPPLVRKISRNISSSQIVSSPVSSTLNNSSTTTASSSPSVSVTPVNSTISSNITPTPSAKPPLRHNLSQASITPKPAPVSSFTKPPSHSSLSLSTPQSSNSGNTATSPSSTSTTTSPSSTSPTSTPQHPISPPILKPSRALPPKPANITSNPSSSSTTSSPIPSPSSSIIKPSTAKALPALPTQSSSATTPGSTLKFNSVANKTIGQSSTLPASTFKSTGSSTSPSGSTSVPNSTTTSPSSSFLLRPTGGNFKKLPALPNQK